MADTLGEALGRILDGYDQRNREAREREQKSKDDDAQFLNGFLALRQSTIRPVFEAAAAVLKARGHEATISEQEFARDAGGSVTEAGITLHIAPAGMAAQMHDDHARALSVSTRHYNKTVWINAGKAMNAGGLAGSKGAYPLEQLNRQKVEEELLVFVAGILG